MIRIWSGCYALCLTSISSCNYRSVTFVRTPLIFLGHVLSGTELKRSPTTSAAILDAPVPQTGQQLSSFLGLVNFYTDFVPDLATKAKPLHALAQMGNTFQWSKECEKSFEEIKKDITLDMSLALYDPNAPMFLTTDASEVGISAILSQLQKAKELMVACASHTLQPAECNYSTVEQEALACVWGAEKFERFPWGRHFTLRTDHQALTFLFQGPAKAEHTRRSSKLVQWAEQLAAFDFDVQYIWGLDNAVADALSRLLLPSSDYALPKACHDIMLKRIMGDDLTLDELQAATAGDEMLQEVVRYVQTQWPPKQNVSATLLPYYHSRNELHIEQGCLVRDCQFIPPTALHKQILGLAHSGHRGSPG